MSIPQKRLIRLPLKGEKNMNTPPANFHSKLKPPTTISINLIKQKPTLLQIKQKKSKISVSHQTSKSFKASPDTDKY